MLEIMSMLFSGPAGGIVGSITGLFKQNAEANHDIEMARIRMERDAAERQHELNMLEASTAAEADMTRIESEAKADIEMARTQAQAQDKEFSKLNTSRWMDNFRASVRPLLAYTFSISFLSLLLWAFMTFRNEISPGEGYNLLMSLIASLEFTISAVVTFYYVVRPNARKKLPE